MHVGFLFDAALDQGASESRLEAAALDRKARLIRDDAGRKEPRFRTVAFPELAQHLQCFLWQGHAAVLGPLTPDAQLHPSGVHVIDLECGGLAGAQATGVNGREEGSIQWQADALQKASHLLGAEDRRQRSPFGRVGQLQTGPRTLEGVLEQEFDCT